MGSWGAGEGGAATWLRCAGALKGADLPRCPGVATLSLAGTGLTLSWS